MTKELKIVENVDFNITLTSLESTQKLCEALMKTKHYAKMGPEGIFAVVAKAKSLNIDPLDALNGGLYCVQGKVEMSSQMMNLLIRQAGHCLAKDPKSDDTICILHGKRVDTGDLWTESFSINEAKRAGIYKEGSPWAKYPRDMLFARALSRLARQLFPDVIKGCYVDGEISQSIAADNAPVVTQVEEPIISLEDAKLLEQSFDFVPEYKEKVLGALKSSFNVTEFKQLPLKMYERIKNGLMKKLEELDQLETVEAIKEA